LLLLGAAVGLLLLVACTNVAHLLMARSASREREMAIRAALGAGTHRLFRQLLAESALLTSAGALLGLGVGWVALRILIAMRPSGHDELLAARLDGTTVAVAVAASAIAGLVFGLVSAMRTSRGSTHDSLRGGARTSVTRGHRRLRAVLVVSEVAVSAMLLVGAGLVVRTLQHFQRTELGFAPQGLYTLYLDFDPARSDPAVRGDAVRQLERRVSFLPGVRSTTVAEAGPGSRFYAVGRMEIEGEPTPPETSTSFVEVNRVNPGYFRTIGARLVEGATFTDSTARAVIVNEAFARRHWSRGDAVGRRIRLAQQGNESWLTIAGVVHDALLSGPMSPSAAPSFYLAHNPAADANLLVRTTGDPAEFRTVRQFARQLGIRDVTVEGAEAFVAQSISEPRFVVLVLGSFSVVALALAAIGLYGLMAFTVAQETREIGIRLALGASRGHLVRRVLARGGGLAAGGTAAGLVAGIWATKLIESRLHGVSRLDPTVYGTGALVLLAAALAACVVPTRRALAVDAMTAMRDE
jgi:predicted permease